MRILIFYARAAKKKETNRPKYHYDVHHLWRKCAPKITTDNIALKTRRNEFKS